MLISLSLDRPLAGDMLILLSGLESPRKESTPARVLPPVAEGNMDDTAIVSRIVVVESSAPAVISTLETPADQLVHGEVVLNTTTSPALVYTPPPASGRQFDSTDAFQQDPITGHVYDFPSGPKWKDDFGRAMCWTCRQVGHVWRFCSKNEPCKMPGCDRPYGHYQRRCPTLYWQDAHAALRAAPAPANGGPLHGPPPPIPYYHQPFVNSRRAAEYTNTGGKRPTASDAQRFQFYPKPSVASSGRSTTTGLVLAKQVAHGQCK